jgi:ubiquinone/menaquinone biosynthesis C-methylase UbiE
MSAYRAWWAQMSATSDGAIAARQARALCDLLRLSPGDTVLDVPCGDGRLSTHLAACGLTVTAIDKDEEALMLAQQRSGGDGVTWIRADMAALPPFAAFDAVICFWSSFGYLSDSGNQQFVEGVARVLKPGGRMYLDTPVLETLFRHWGGRSSNVSADNPVRQDRRFDFRTSRLERTWSYVSGGERHERITRQRHYSVSELLALVQRAGFVDCELFDDLDRQTFGEDSHKLYLVAARG